MRADNDLLCAADNLAEARGLLGGLASAAVLLMLGVMFAVALFGN